MPANTNPIYTLTPDIAGGAADGNGGTAGPLKTANTAMDGTGTVLTCFTAGANGAYVRKLIARAAGTNVATVMRVFLNNGGSNATIANNFFIGELGIPATTASNSSPLQTFEYPLEFALPASWKINVAIGTSVVAGFLPVVIGGDY